MSEVVKNGLGAALVFTMALGMAWLMVSMMEMHWDRALLVQILWLTALNRWHQPEHPNGRAEP